MFVCMVLSFTKLWELFSRHINGFVRKNLDKLFQTTIGQYKKTRYWYLKASVRSLLDVRERENNVGDINRDL